MQSADCARRRTFQMPASQGRQSGGRRMPRSQTVVFFPSLWNMSILYSCYFQSIRWLIIHLVLGKRSVLFLLPQCCAKHLYLARGKLKSSNILQGSISRSARWQKTDAQPYSGVKFTGASFAPLTLHLRYVSRLALWGLMLLLDPFLARLAFVFLSHFCFLSQFVVPLDLYIYCNYLDNLVGKFRIYELLSSLTVLQQVAVASSSRSSQ